MNKHLMLPERVLSLTGSQARLRVLAAPSGRFCVLRAFSVVLGRRGGVGI